MKTIILVEDEKILSDVVSDVLTDAGYKVFVAGTGEECFKIIETTKPDLAILDIRLPDMSGLKVLKEIRHKFTDVPIIMCTAYDSYKTDYEIWASKVADYIVKPVDLDALREKIRKVFEGGDPKRARILIVEDEVLIVDTLKSILVNERFDVVGICNTADTAVAKTRELQPALILMDFILIGKKTGVDAYNEIRDFTSTPVIFISASEKETVIKNIDKKKNVDFMDKPVDVDELIRRINDFLKEKRNSRTGKIY